MQKNSTVAIVGYGYVGKAMHKIFPDAVVYDENPDILAAVHGEKSKEQVRALVNECDLAIICVPTPPRGIGAQDVPIETEGFLPVDTSIVEEVVGWLQTPLILVKSTIPPGTTDRLRKLNNGRRVCFSPEYIGEGNYHVPAKYPHPTDPREHSFLIIGGEEHDATQILEIFQRRLGPAKRYLLCTAVEAECIKYLENTWGAMKVAFCNEWYDLCQALGANWHRVREGWLLDSRVEEMHTAVFPSSRGFGGKCYPKDLHGIIATAEQSGQQMPLLRSVWKKNQELRMK